MCLTDVASHPGSRLPLVPPIASYSCAVYGLTDLVNTAWLAVAAPDAGSDATFELRLTDPAGIEVHTNLTDVGAGSFTLGWMHVALAYDGTDLLTWAAGSPVSAFVWPAAEPPDIVALTLGTDRSGALAFAGSLDDVLIFDRALTDAEVAALADGTATCLAL